MEQLRSWEFNYSLKQAVQNLVKVDIYYEEFNREEYTQSPSYPVSNHLCCVSSPAK